MRAARRGVALLDAVAALAVLGTTLTAVLTLVIQANDATRAAMDRERRTREAGRFMEAVLTWPSSDLDRRLGSHRQGPWLLSITRTDRTLYRIELLTTDSLPILSTAAWRAP